MLDSDQLRDRLEAGIRELEEDIARCRAAIAALDRAGPARAPERRLRARVLAADPDYAVVPAGKLTQLLADSGSAGLTTADLADRSHGDPAQVLALLKELEEAGEVHRTGNRRSTRWHHGGSAETTPAPGDAAPATAEREPTTTEPQPTTAEPEPEPTTTEPQPTTAEPEPEPTTAEPEPATATGEPEPAPGQPGEESASAGNGDQDPETVSISALTEGTRTA